MGVEKQKFDYLAAISELESIAAKVEDPETPVEDMEKSIRRSVELVSACRAYLRGVKESVEEIDKELL